MLVRRKKKVKISVKRIRRFLKKVSKRDAFTCSLKEAICQRDGPYFKYKTAKEKAPEMQTKFQESLAIAITVKKGTDVDTESNNLKRIGSERQANAWTTWKQSCYQIMVHRRGGYSSSM
jgi:hypothetical protein